jgi:predicted nucleic acid-binding Zn ribbon protein
MAKRHSQANTSRIVMAVLALTIILAMVLSLLRF